MKTVLFLLLLAPGVSHAALEKYYSEIFCLEQGGVSEVVLSDRTRVDCLTDEYAIEVDFAYKWYNGVGQALHYATVTGKRPAVALIMDDSEARFYERLENLNVCPKIRIFRIDRL